MKQPTFFILILALLGGSCYIQFSSGLSWDKDWLMRAAGMWLSGKTLYVDIVDPNPPLIIWLYALPGWLVLHLHMDTGHALTLFGFFVTLLSVSTCRRLLLCGPEFGEKRLMQATLLLVFILIARVHPVHFADRDHLFVVLVFPHVLRWLPALRKTTPPLTLRLAIGVMAAIGFCIKPQCFVVFAGLQVIYVLKERRLRSLASLENSVVYGLAVFYGALVWQVTPDYLFTYLPMARQYLNNHIRVMGMLTNIPLLLLLLGIALAEFRPSACSPLRDGSLYCLAACFCFLLYALANNGWAYTYLPLETMLLFTFGWLCWDYGETKKSVLPQGFAPGQKACLAAIGLSVALTAAGLWGFTPSSGSCETSSGCMRDRDFVRKLKVASAPSFGIFSLNFLPWGYYAQASGASWELRLNCFWMLMPFMKQDADYHDAHEWILSTIANATAADLDNRKPRMIFNDATPVFKTGDHYVFIDTLLIPYPKFKQAWSHYHRVGTFDECGLQKDVRAPSVPTTCRYDVYLRQD